MEENKKKKSIKDRRDAKWIKMPAMLRIMTYLKDRQEAYVYICRKFDVTDLVKYMKEKKKNNKDLTYFHAFSIAIAPITLQNDTYYTIKIGEHIFYIIVFFKFVQKF